MIRTLYFSGQGGFTHEVPPEAVEPMLRQAFDFHPLAIDDPLRERHVPKIDNWGEYAYAVVHEVRFDHDSLELQTHELDVFLGPNYIVTHHRQPVEAVNRVYSSCLTDQRRLARG